MKRWTDLLRTEFGKIADIVWSQNEEARGGLLHSKLLDSMNNSQKVTGEPMDRELAITMITAVIFAGYETTANVIIEALYELSRHPDMQTKLRHELVDFSERLGREPTYDDIMNPAQFTYLDALTRETLRTKAVQMTIYREAAVEDTIPLQFPIHCSGETAIAVQAGQLAHIPLRHGINVDTRIWGPDAALFRPERWLDEGGLPDVVKDIRAPGHLLTFGDGPKICLGRHFALTEIKIILAALVRDLIFEPDDEEYVFYKTGGNTVKPKIVGREHEGPQLYLRIRKSEER
ncbi:uncharacterized protein FIBRA_00631 [Fibroporia radiculosa]|uniref:Cytochrome P450 n=1 Tax=Fibroporia radiculosa TaxID=599839 RepID=J4H0D6_9APHY|nr:uncharacterized protein FIBRA_00631 [Fibroporia radiculosa]CCL98629.1 predicted protein [Fibroporia radiculosa]